MTGLRRLPPPTSRRQARATSRPSPRQQEACPRLLRAPNPYMPKGRNAWSWVNEELNLPLSQLQQVTGCDFAWPRATKNSQGHSFMPDSQLHAIDATDELYWVNGLPVPDSFEEPDPDTQSREEAPIANGSRPVVDFDFNSSSTMLQTPRAYSHPPLELRETNAVHQSKATSANLPAISPQAGYTSVVQSFPAHASFTGSYQNDLDVINGYSDDDFGFDPYMLHASSSNDVRYQQQVHESQSQAQIQKAQAIPMARFDHDSAMKILHKIAEAQNSSMYSTANDAQTFTGYSKNTIHQAAEDLPAIPTSRDTLSDLIPTPDWMKKDDFEIPGFDLLRNFTYSSSIPGETDGNSHLETDKFAPKANNYPIDPAMLSNALTNIAIDQGFNGPLKIKPALSTPAHSSASFTSSALGQVPVLTSNTASEGTALTTPYETPYNSTPCNTTTYNATPGEWDPTLLEGCGDFLDPPFSTDWNEDQSKPFNGQPEASEYSSFDPNALGLNDFDTAFSEAGMREDQDTTLTLW